MLREVGDMARGQERGEAEVRGAETGAAEESVGFLVLGGRRVSMERHPTDFTVPGLSAEFRATGTEPSGSGSFDEPVERKTNHKGAGSVILRRLPTGALRVRAAGVQERDQEMNRVRPDSVAHHVYRVAATAEEFVLTGRILLTLDGDDPDRLEEIAQKLHLRPEARIGDTYLLRVTRPTGVNPLKAARLARRRSRVMAAAPEVLTTAGASLAAANTAALESEQERPFTGTVRYGPVQPPAWFDEDATANSPTKTWLLCMKPAPGQAPTAGHVSDAYALAKSRVPSGKHLTISGIPGQIVDPQTLNWVPTIFIWA